MNKQPLSEMTLEQLELCDRASVHLYRRTNLIAFVGVILHLKVNVDCMLLIITMIFRGTTVLLVMNS